MSDEVTRAADTRTRRRTTIMAHVAPGAGAGAIEDELVGAAMQISELRQETKSLKRALGRCQDEISR